MSVEDFQGGEEDHDVIGLKLNRVEACLNKSK
jgi:hypothetical protein